MRASARLTALQNQFRHRLERPQLLPLRFLNLCGREETIRVASCLKVHAAVEKARLEDRLIRPPITLLFVDTNNVLDFRRCAIESPEMLPSDVGGTAVALSLAAAVDIALFRLNQATEVDYLRRLGSPQIEAIRELLTSTKPYCADKPFKHHSFEAFPIRAFEDLQSNEWVLFRARFVESAKAGKKGDIFHGVSSVLAEMADNVVCHAGVRGDDVCRGVAAYYITPRTASFSVADNGQAFLASLRMNPQWKGLATEQEALKAVLLRRATSRTNEATGGGFSVLYNKLVSFNGMVMLRSGDCRATIKNTAAPANSLILRLGEHNPGAQVTVIIAKKGNPVEEPLQENP